LTAQQKEKLPISTISQCFAGIAPFQEKFMKKKYLALLIPAALLQTASFASQVTLFGAVDEYVAVNHTQSIGTKTAIKSGGVSASHWGIKGVEDLGNGTQVFFNLDQAFLADNGAMTASGGERAWSREANVGIRGSLGSLSFGRQYTPHFLTFLFYDPTGLSIGSSYSGMFFPGPNSTCGDWGDLVRTDNSVSYVLPTNFGLTNFFFAALGEHGNSNSRGNLYNYAAKFDAGKFSAMGSYMYQSVANAIPGSAYAAKDKRYKVQWLNFAASYDFGITKPAVNFMKKFGTPEAGSNSLWLAQVGTSTPVMGGLWMISGTYLRNQSREDANAWGVGTKYNYPLSKRTRVYAGYQYMHNGKNSGYSVEAGPDSSLHFNNSDANTVAGTGYGTTYLGKSVNEFFVGISHEF
jgi:predicted porin